MNAPTNRPPPLNRPPPPMAMATPMRPSIAELREQIIENSRIAFFDFYRGDKTDITFRVAALYSQNKGWTGVVYSGDKPAPFLYGVAAATLYQAYEKLLCASGELMQHVDGDEEWRPGLYTEDWVVLPGGGHFHQVPVYDDVSIDSEELDDGLAEYLPQSATPMVQ